jgi:hypothetical protein
MTNITRLDRVFTFGGKLSFLIPHEWVEEVEDGNDDYLYHQPGIDSGWLRVSLLTIRAVDETPSQRLYRVFAGRDNVKLDQQTGNSIDTWEKDSEEKGNQIHLYYWKVANIVTPDLVRIAVFSYTILRARMNNEGNLEVVKLIDQLASEAKFSNPT